MKVKENYINGVGKLENKENYIFYICYFFTICKIQFDTASKKEHKFSCDDEDEPSSVP